MSEPSWRIDELDPEPLAAAPSSPALVTMHFLATALRRRWRVWVGLGCVGMLLGLAWTLASPPKSTGTITLLLAHDTSADPQQALATDISLLRTRTLAVEVVERLDLDMTPDEFQQSVTGVPDSTDVLVLEVTGPDDATAVERAQALGEAYLTFRASQIESQKEALNRGYEKRITTLRAEAEELRRQYDALSTDDPGDARRAGALVNRQAQVSTEIEGIQRSIRDASLKTQSIIDASYVLDPAASKPQPSMLKPLLLAMASGLVAATAAGVGLVLTSALVSGRLRLREEVALALDAPVRVSAGDLRPRRSPWPFPRKDQDPSVAREILVDALDQLVARPAKTRSRTRLALACVDNPEAGRMVVEGLVERLGSEGLAVFVVDLSAGGDLAVALDQVSPQQAGDNGRSLVVHRPDRVPSLVQGPAGPAGLPSTVSSEELRNEAWKQADVVVALADLEPAMGAEHLNPWVEDVVVLVTAGRSSAERLRTTGELIRSAGLRLPFVLMVGSDQFDESLGLPLPSSGGRPPWRVS